MKRWNHEIEIESKTANFASVPHFVLNLYLFVVELIRLQSLEMEELDHMKGQDQVEIEFDRMKLRRQLKVVDWSF